MALDAGCGNRADDRIRSERIKKITVQFVLLRGALVGLAGLYIRHAVRRHDTPLARLLLGGGVVCCWFEDVPAPAPDWAHTGADNMIANEHTTNTKRVRRIFILKNSFKVSKPRWFGNQRAR